MLETFYLANLLY